jgi:predicted permease
VTARSPDRPPARWLFLARALVRRDRRDEVEGDLIELWGSRRASGRAARLGFWRDTLSLVLRRRARSRRRPVVARSGGWMRDAAQDVRYAGRLIARQPAFTALAIGTLTAGIAASTAIFTLADRVLLRPLPFADADRIVAFATAGRESIDVSDDVARLAQFRAVATHAAGGMNLGDDPSAVRVRAGAVSSAFFDVLGVSPLLGRVFSRDDAGDARVAIVSFDAWRRYFSSDPAVLERTIRLNSRSYSVIGVMPRGFAFPQRADVWIPAKADHDLNRTSVRPTAIARLAQGVTVIEAAHALTAAKQARARRYDERASAQPVVVTSLRDDLAGPFRPTVLLLAALVGLLLVITCANVAGLLLSRLRVRERELLVRKALGASRGRLVRQLVAECFVMTTAGATLGLALALWAIGFVESTVPAFAPDLTPAGVDARFFVTGVAVALAVGVVLSLGPVVAASRTPVAAMTRETSGSAGIRRRWLGTGLVIGQVAAAAILLAAASAALLTVARLTRIDLGFNNGTAVIFDLTLPTSRYDGPVAVAQFIARAETRLAGLPGVRHVGATSLAPGGAGVSSAAILRLAENAHDPDPIRRPNGTLSVGFQPGPLAPLIAASPGYFEAMGIRLIAGRAFTPADGAKSPPVVILTESAARALASDVRTLVGRQFALGDRPWRPAEIVGIAADARLLGLRDVSHVMGLVYQPATQNIPRGTLSIAVDAGRDSTGVIPAVRTVLRGIDPELPPYNISQVDDLHARFLVTERLTLGLTSAFAAMAVALCAIGLYGVLAQVVSQRTREIGIRMALGADRRALRRSVVFHGLRLATMGVAAGALTAGVASRAAAAVIPSLDRPDALVIAADAALLLLIAALAAWIPARRASAVDPMLALRAE